MGLLKNLGKLFKQPHDNWFTTIRDIVKYTIKCETSSQLGRINLIGGILVALFIFSCCFKNFFEKIISIFVPGFDDPIPLWIIVIFLIFLIVYFLGCVKFVSNFDTSHKGDNN